MIQLDDIENSELNKIESQQSLKINVIGGQPSLINMNESIFFQNSTQNSCEY
jgi:hypothetical protein